MKPNEAKTHTGATCEPYGPEYARDVYYNILKRVNKQKEIEKQAAIFCAHNPECVSRVNELNNILECKGDLLNTYNAAFAFLSGVLHNSKEGAELEQSAAERLREDCIFYGELVERTHAEYLDALHDFILYTRL